MRLRYFGDSRLNAVFTRRRTIKPVVLTIADAEAAPRASVHFPMEPGSVCSNDIRLPRPSMRKLRRRCDLRFPLDLECLGFAVARSGFAQERPRINLPNRKSRDISYRDS